MEELLKSIQKIWDNMDSEGKLTEDFKATYPRPESIEDANKFMESVNSGNSALYLLTLILLALLPYNWYFINNENLFKNISEDK